MLTNDELQGLARTVADLPLEQQYAVADAVAGIRAERARQEERPVDLRALSDIEAVEAAFEANQVMNSWPPEPALQVLREAGLVRGAVLEKAYREGYERYGYEHLGEGCPMPDEDDPDYVTMRGYDLADLLKAPDHAGA